MKAGNLLFILILFLLPLSLLSEEKWVQYTSAGAAKELVHEGIFLWIGTSSGLVKLNKETGERTFYNNANSDLPVNEINDLAIDSSGNKWIGTDIGLVKFDGKDWTIYNESNAEIPDNEILAITVDHNGNIWFSTKYKYLIKFDGNNWSEFYYETYFVDEITLLAVDNLNDLWIISENGIFKKMDLTDNSLEHFYRQDVPNYIYAVTIEKPNNIWFAGSQGVLVIKENDTISYVQENSNYVSIDIDKYGNKWFGSNLWGLSKFDGENWYRYTKTNSPLNVNSISALSSDNEGNLWIGTFNDGVYKYQEDKWENFNISNSPIPINFALNDIHKMVFDKNDNCWIAISDLGVVKFDGINCEIYTPDNSGLPDNNVKDIALDSADNIWVASNHIYRFDGINWELMKESSPFRSFLVTDKEGNVWLNYNGANRFDGEKWIKYDQDNSGLQSSVSAICVDDHNNKWFCTREGVVKYDNSDWTLINNDEIRNEFITSMLIESENSIWLSTTSYGVPLSHYNGTDWENYYTYNSELPHAWVYELVIDHNDNIWVGTVDGALKISGEEWTVYNKYNSGMVHNRVTSISVDSKNNVWIATADGSLNGIAVLLSETTDVAFDEESSSNISIYPNPAQKKATLKFALEEAANTRIEISDITGQYRSMLFSGFKHAGGNTFEFSVDHLPAGMYFLRISSGGNVITKKLIVLR